MVSCCVPGCKQRSANAAGISFHRFPVNEARRNLWANEIKRLNWAPTAKTAICSIHFEDTCYSQTVQNRKRLLDDAIPKIFPDKYEKINKKTKQPMDSKSELDKPQFISAVATQTISSVPNLSKSTNKDTPTEKKLGAKFNKLKLLAEKRLRVVRTLRKSDSRKTKRILGLKQTISEFKRNRYFPRNDREWLHNIDGNNFQLLTFLQNFHLKKPHKYPPVVRTFALTLHFLSPKAYEFVRKTFNNSLPSSRMIKMWCHTSECHLDTDYISSTDDDIESNIELHKVPTNKS